ncbi:MAG: hypothetical protein PHZ07_01725 [Patescibacteria group bacterium]|nr:hypothetical protein [Patescibacteria group bacterium]MDD4304095.1 hypothetical protein [Patescibacteria group bacterium]MDD4694972.1 hypothetical protein [Patescibacteria group bacterium]
MNKKFKTIIILILFFIFIVILIFIIDKPKQVQTKPGIIKLETSSKIINQIQGSNNLFQNIEVGGGFQATNSNLQAISSETIFNRQDLNIK